ncbi:hypothetical protein [Paenibacillus sp. ACRRY]|uniref:hypothetical protein n=1 Tax=Paenibacillus sp. ACRRY TaxID=2918208 RepID=UPI001EF56B56|nr:hypothetical protein [Paenibacillus sp. ACRRY]MCG7385057.1 hypothetical protein [Paenibacillus sp. ACRRY]
MPTPTESLTAAYLNCKDRNCSKEQLINFLDRAKTQWTGNEGMQATIKFLESQI